MNSYIIIRSDTKNISYPMTKQEALKVLRQNNKDGISSLIVPNKKSISYSVIHK